MGSEGKGTKGDTKGGVRDMTKRRRLPDPLPGQEWHSTEKKPWLIVYDDGFVLFMAIIGCIFVVLQCAWLWSLEL